uniref:Uncharacterized protein n=1 Tax=Romanomermis culicivorax TaxID=13658 RepID=A0A915JNP6_ROMCU
MAMTLALIARIDQNDRKLATISTNLDQDFHSMLELEKAYSMLTQKHDKNYYLKLLKTSLIHVFKGDIMPDVGLCLASPLLASIKDSQPFLLIRRKMKKLVENEGERKMADRKCQDFKYY